MNLIAQATSQNTPDFKGADGDWTPHNAGVTPHFFVDKIVRKELDGTETEIEIEKVIIAVAGDTLTECSLPVDDQLRERFAAAYEAWKTGKDLLVGVPVSEWDAITARQATFLEANNIFTVEDLAALTDYNVVNVQGGRELRDKAIRWLKKKGTSDLAAENARIKDELAELKKWKAETERKKRPPMPQERRDRIGANTKARWARIAELTEAASVADKSEVLGNNELVLPNG